MISRPAIGDLQRALLRRRSGGAARAWLSVVSVIGGILLLPQQLPNAAPLGLADYDRTQAMQNLLTRSERLSQRAMASICVGCTAVRAAPILAGAPLQPVFAGLSPASARPVRIARSHKARYAKLRAGRRHVAIVRVLPPARPAFAEPDDTILASSVEADTLRIAARDDADVTR